MICPPCKGAGSWKCNPEMIGVIRELHQQCQAPTTCPCQHATESVKQNAKS